MINRICDRIDNSKASCIALPILVGLIFVGMMALGMAWTHPF